MSTPNEVLEATTSFVCEIKGQRFTVNEGITRVEASHELAQHYPQSFRPVSEGLSYRIEEATADPGAVRNRPPTDVRPVPVTTEGAVVTPATDAADAAKEAEAAKSQGQGRKARGES